MAKGSGINGIPPGGRKFGKIAPLSFARRTPRVNGDIIFLEILLNDQAE